MLSEGCKTNEKSRYVVLSISGFRCDIVCLFELGGDILKNRIEKLKQNDSSPDEQAVGKTRWLFLGY